MPVLKPNPGPMQGQQGFFNTEPSFQPLRPPLEHALPHQYLIVGLPNCMTFLEFLCKKTNQQVKTTGLNTGPSELNPESFSLSLSHFLSRTEMLSRALTLWRSSPLKIEISLLKKEKVICNLSILSKCEERDKLGEPTLPAWLRVRHYH